MTRCRRIEFAAVFRENVRTSAVVQGYRECIITVPAVSVSVDFSTILLHCSRRGFRGGTYGTSGPMLLRIIKNSFFCLARPWWLFFLPCFPLSSGVGATPMHRTWFGQLILCVTFSFNDCSDVWEATIQSRTPETRTMEHFVWDV